MTQIASPQTRDASRHRAILRRYAYLHFTAEEARMAVDSEVFNSFYDGTRRDWGGSSGPGSYPEFTIGYRLFLERFIVMNRVTSITDIGCGDWQFSRFLNFNGARYIGYDVVENLIAHNNTRFASHDISFQRMPENIRSVVGGDLLIIKDVLQHLPTDMIKEYVRIICPKFKTCLLTNSFEKLNTPLNTDIKAGDFRCLDLKEAPFSFRGSYVYEYWTCAWERIRTFLYTAE